MAGYRSEPLAPGHNTTSFDCGEPSLNSWLTDHALTSASRMTARTWAWVNEEETVLGYFALTAHRVRREDIPSRIGRGGPIEVPAVLIARLGLDRSLQGHGLGSVLVADAVARIVQATQLVAARLIVVDALHEKVANFYERLGFQRIPGSLTLVLKVTDATAAVQQATN